MHVVLIAETLLLLPVNDEGHVPARNDAFVKVGLTGALLVDTGVLGRDGPSVFRPTRHPVIDAAARQAVVDQVRAAATGAGPVRPDVAVVLALAGPCRLLERVAPDRSTRREAKRRIAAAIAETPFAPGVATIVDELIAAVTATATAIAAA